MNGPATRFKVIVLRLAAEDENGREYQEALSLHPPEGGSLDALQALDGASGQLATLVESMRRDVLHTIQNESADSAGVAGLP